MIRDLDEYFVPDYEFFLDKINYNRIDSDIDDGAVELDLSSQDSIQAAVGENGIQIIVTRTLSFEPENIFSLEVSFGANLIFNERQDEIDWANIDIAEEFYDNGDFIIEPLLSRASLMIGQITSSVGQVPVLLPTSFSEE